MLNVRLDKSTEKKLKEYTEEHDLSKTSVVKEALAQYFTQKELEQRPFALGEDLFGADASDESDLSKSYKSKLRKKLGEKHAR